MQHISDSFVPATVSALAAAGLKQFAMSFQFRASLYKDNKHFALPSRIIHMLVDARTNSQESV